MKLLTTSLAAVALIALAGCNRGAANNTAGNAAAPPAANAAEPMRPSPPPLAETTRAERRGQ